MKEIHIKRQIHPLRRGRERRLFFTVMAFFCLVFAAILLTSQYYAKYTYSPLLLSVFLFSLFFILTFIYIAKRNCIFSLFYLVLFIYTIFTEIAYIYFPTPLLAGFSGQVFGVEVFYKYKLFVFLSFLSIFIVFCFLFRRKKRGYSFSMMKDTTAPIFRDVFFMCVIITYDLLLLFFLLRHYDELNYLNQEALKSSTIFRNAYGFVGIILIVLYAKIMQLSKLSFHRLFYYTLLLITLCLFLLISIRAGDRSTLAATIVGFFMYTILQPSELRERFFVLLKSIVIVLLIAFALHVLMKVRKTGTVDVSEFVSIVFSRPGKFAKGLFSFRGIVLQDYAGPSLTLFFSIKYNIVNFSDSLKSVFLNSLIFTGHPTLGFTLSRIVNPMLSRGWQGYGYYFLTEGYNVMGWYGFLYNAIVFNFGLLIWSKFTNTADKNFKLYLIAVIAMQVFGIVRGQGSEFIRAVYIAFLPATVLYFLATGYRPCFKKRMSR